MARCSAIALQKLTRRSGGGLDTSPKATLLWKSFGRNKEGKVFGILSCLKKLSKSNDVHAQNNFFIRT